MCMGNAMSHAAILDSFVSNLIEEVQGDVAHVHGDPAAGRILPSLPGSEDDSENQNQD